MNYQLEKLLVVKVGTNVLTDTTGELDKLDEKSFRNIGREVRGLTSRKTSVILVSSGAITAGALLDKKRRCDVTNDVDLQRYAVRGWPKIVRAWESAIGAGRVSSTLLTKHEIHLGSTRTKALGLVGCCLAHGDVFVVNENDAICDDEIKFGDNDRLAAELAVACATTGLFQSVKLVLLTNKNGLNMVADDDATIIRTVTDIAAVEKYAGRTVDKRSRGGMITKIQAAKIATKVGIETCIANGRKRDVVARTLRGEIGTRFVVDV
ncbi:MAG: hypothetical protein LBQ02_03445 [Candidatus Nomurabacteria bacterium]|nr:hypothetical protein [Candidatus Nomurabacteria bacterium]